MLYTYYITAFVITLLALALYLKVSSYYHWFDQPDESRKLHKIAKPTSAGIIFMLPCVLILYFFPEFLPFGSRQVVFSLLLLIILGGIDDFIPTSAKLKFTIITLISAWLLYSLNHHAPINSYLWVVYLLGLIWWINLYNFMDGADGMAALHALATLVGYFILYVNSHNLEIQIIINVILLLFFCILSFLLFNFPRSKMFMGDSGSLSIAFMLAAIAMYGLTLNLFDEILIISFHLVFIVDATLTLFTRIKFGHKITQAHNLHYFQAYIEDGNSHGTASLLYLFVTAITVGLAVFLHLQDLELLIRFSILLLEVIILSIFWFKYHNKTKFKRFYK
jgi:UDP-N-acetylmuramyl pentapeptide phosphotransferase/UDP-N-acetylglucosamine-1-phosphate transferase